MKSISTELEALRDLREISLAIRDLKNQQSAVMKRFKTGIRLLERERLTAEQSVDMNSNAIPGGELWETRSPELKALIANPTLKNIAESNTV